MACTALRQRPPRGLVIYTTPLHHKLPSVHPELKLDHDIQHRTEVRNVSTSREIITTEVAGKVSKMIKLAGTVYVGTSSNGQSELFGPFLLKGMK
jgi:hypothetical protein